MAESIQSCIDQSYKNWELIIVDDSSTDETAHIIETYKRKDERIKSIRHPNNKKLPAALNTGFAAATGDFFTWTSDDNRYRPCALEELSNYLVADSDCGFVYCDYSIIDADGTVGQRCVVKEPEELAVGNGIGPSFLYRREVAVEVGRYDERMFLAEDYDYWLRVSKVCRMVRIPAELYLYRVHENSLTTKKRELISNAAAKALIRNLPTMRWLSGRVRTQALSGLARDPAIATNNRLRLLCYLGVFRISPKTFSGSFARVSLNYVYRFLRNLANS